MRKKTSASRECTAPNLMDFEWSSMLFFLSLSKPSQSTRMVLAIRLFEFRGRKDICSVYAKLLQRTVYACDHAKRCNSVFIPPAKTCTWRTNSRANLCTIRENEHHGAHFRGVRTRVFVPPAKMCTMQID